jgi:hypothetical protein
MVAEEIILNQIFGGTRRRGDADRKLRKVRRLALFNLIQRAIKKTVKKVSQV